MKPRRSMLFIPGANAAMLSTSFVYGADAVMFDLEDAVSLREKDTARLLVYQALQHPLYQDIETVVRINPLNTPFGLADLEAVVRAGVDMVRLPKTDSKEDIHELEAHVERIERSMPAAPCYMLRGSPASPPMTSCGRILIMKRASSRKRIWRRTSASTGNHWSTRARSNCCTRSMPRREKRSTMRWR